MFPDPDRREARQGTGGANATRRGRIRRRPPKDLPRLATAPVGVRACGGKTYCRRRVPQRRQK